MHDLVDQRMIGIGLEGQALGEQAVHHHAERIEVALRTDGLVLDLFRRHVIRRADQTHRLGLVQLFELGDTEIHDLHGAVVRHHDVARLDVAVHHAFAVRVIECLAAFEDDVDDLLDLHPLVATGKRLQGLAVDQLHDDVVLHAVDTGIVDGNDIRMLEIAGRMGLDEEGTLEATTRGRIAARFRARHLDRNRALHEGIIALVDHAHAAPTDAALDDVFADLIRL